MPSATFGFLGNPFSTEVKTGAYTIPAGYYAYITACVNASASGVLVSGGGTVGSHVADCASQSASFWVPTGTDLDVATSAASASTATSNTTISGTSVASVTVDTAVAVTARAYVAVRMGTSSGSDTAAISGDVSARYIVQLFEE